MLKVLTVVGTRPEAVKMAPVIQLLSRTDGVVAKVCLTAQHREMLDQVFRLFAIIPHYDLDLMQPNQSLAGLTAAIFTHLDPVLEDFQPDWLLAQGDTTTVMAVSILAYYHRIRFGHVEAGLRTYDKWRPFPEEINRKIAGVVADLHFAPTPWARDNLLRESIAAESIIVTGNPVIDALHQVTQLPLDPTSRQLLNRLGITEASSRRLILVTAHRRENFGKPLENICEALVRLADLYGDSLRILYPVHRNPNVIGTVIPYLKGHPGIILTEPLDYLPMVQMMKNAYLVLTDSGGLQEEAPALGVPVLVMREVTERPEGLKAGTLCLVGTHPDRIVENACALLNSREEYLKMAKATNPFGDGHAAERIVDAIVKIGKESVLFES
jgi:UDP-N-acetylglucosamine 2-epimerase (non-hydrolysing)